MSKNGAPPPYGFVPPPSAPPSYAQAVGGVQPSSPFTPQQVGPTRIVTTVVPIGPHPTHMICPSCHSEMDTSTRTEPGLIAYISGFVIAMLGYKKFKKIYIFLNNFISIPFQMLAGLLPDSMLHR